MADRDGTLPHIGANQRRAWNSYREEEALTERIRIRARRANKSERISEVGIRRCQTRWCGHWHPTRLTSCPDCFVKREAR